MIRHIFKKDLALLWPFVAGLTVLQIVIELARHLAVVRGDEPIILPFELLGIAVWVLLVPLVAHQDPLPGTRQDWLTRPIKRVDLLLAKLLFLAALLHGPTFIANAADVFAAGFPLPQALGAAAANGFAIFAAVTLPALALAAVTRTTTEFLIAAIMGAVILEVVSLPFIGITGTGCGPTCETSIQWTATLAQPALLVTAALAVLALQYFRRDATRSARAVVAATPVLLVVLWNMPWGMGLAIQQSATGVVEPQDRVAIELDSEPRSPLAPPSAAAQSTLFVARASLAGNEIGQLDRQARRRANSTDPLVSLPLRVSGLRPGEVIWTDRVVFRLINADGRVFRGTADALEIRGDDGATQPAQQTFSVPAYLVEAARGIDLRLELDYWITSLEPTAELTLPAPGGEAELSGAKCSTGLRRNGEAVRFVCVSIGRPPSCYTAALENRSTGARRLNVLICDPNYDPFRGDFRLFRPFAITLPLADRSAAASTVVQIAAYSARAHSTSRLVVPRLRLSDWAATGQ